MDHGDGNNKFRCSMKMLFNWDYTNLCIVFSWWKVSGVPLLLFSCLMVGLIGVFYEFLKFLSRKYDDKIYESCYRQISNNEEESPSNLENRVVRLTRSQQLIRSFIYAIQAFISFFIMLIFMTYNGYLMISVITGAGIGFFFFGKKTVSNKEDEDRVVNCH
ncbi:Ctr copper transporter [Gigaspora margarita]|uniref:Copper transport protein n=1 Tax=Gigaspora margarita TaxID=4874 RepID=A0A8H4AFA4_GIGMA|nr:Ctr copper transporter [Gigaspora margarita]